MKRIFSMENVINYLEIAGMIFILHWLIQNKTVLNSVKNGLKIIVTTFHPWPSIPIVILIVGAVILFKFYDPFRKLIGEDRSVTRHRYLNIIFIPLFMALSFYFLLDLNTPEALSPTSQLLKGA